MYKKAGVSGGDANLPGSADTSVKVDGAGLKEKIEQSAAQPEGYITTAAVERGFEINYDDVSADYAVSSSVGDGAVRHTSEAKGTYGVDERGAYSKHSVSSEVRIGDDNVNAEGKNEVSAKFGMDGSYEVSDSAEVKAKLGPVEKGAQFEQTHGEMPTEEGTETTDTSKATSSTSLDVGNGTKIKTIAGVEVSDSVEDTEKSTTQTESVKMVNEVQIEVDPQKSGYAAAAGAAVFNFASKLIGDTISEVTKSESSEETKKDNGESEEAGGGEDEDYDYYSGYGY